MSKDLFQIVRDDLDKALDLAVARNLLPAGLDRSKIVVTPPRDSKHGDVANNAPFILAPQVRKSPNDIARILAPLIAETSATVANIQPAGGFINATFRNEPLFGELRTILRAGTSYGDCRIGQGRRVNVEYVSANPTGPMHVGHCRGAVVGDALAALLAKAGYEVTREYYINDAGAQVDVLARSLHLRYREALGEEIGAIPEGFYPGEYLVAPAQKLVAHVGIKYLGKPDAEWLPEFRQFAVTAMMELIRGDLAAMGVRHGVFTSEQTLVAEGQVEAMVAKLEARDLVYTGTLEPPKGMLPEDWEPRPQLLFRSTRYGDDVDRPLRKSDGSWTYFATDIAYHFDKYQRGFAHMVDVWGADHGGYVKRMQAAVKAITEGQGTLEVRLCQMVNLLKDGQPYKMSKRAGTFVTLREVVDEVGKDVVRFIMLTRKNDAQLDFDLARVVEQSRDNPVFYVQYAHARAHSVLRHAALMFPDADLSAHALGEVPLDRLTDPAELALIRQMAAWPRLVEGAAEAEEPHRIAFYLYDLAAVFHALWNLGKDDATLRFLVEADRELSLARAALVRGMALVVASGLAVFGVEPVEEMR